MKILTVMFLFPFGVAIGKRCPDEALLQPCNCTENDEHRSVVKCDNFDSLDDLQKMFYHSLDYSFDELFLTECVLPYLNVTWFSSKNVKNLYLDSLTLIDLLDNTDVFVPSVTRISIKHTTILRGGRWQQFRVFNQLTDLDMGDVKVGKLGNDFKSNVPASLEYLNIENADVAGLRDEDFEGKTNLTDISMWNNRIKILKSSFFKDQKTILHTIDFSHNPIEYLPAELFVEMTALQIVVFDFTLIKTLPKELSLSKPFVELSLMDNPMICDCKMSWFPEMLEKPPFYFLYGNCVSPPSLQSRPLDQLKYTDFEACNSHYQPFTSGYRMFLNSLPLG